MSSTITETVTVDRDTIIDALAHMEAAEEILIALNDNYAPTDLSEPIGDAKFGLWIAAFGELPEGNEEYERDPVNVEVHARGAEIAAAAFEKSFAEFEPILANHRELATLREHARTLERRAQVYREQGTIAPGRRDA